MKPFAFGASIAGLLLCGVSLILNNPNQAKFWALYAIVGALIYIGSKEPK